MNLAGLFRAFRATRAPAAALVIATAHPVVAAPIPVTTIETIATPTKRSPSKAKGRFIAGTLVASLCCSTITGFEAIRTTAYRDSVGIPTVCIGETKGVRMGMKFTTAQCEQMLVDRLGKDFAPAVERCITRPMSDEFFAAAVSLTYNSGIGSAKYPGFCQSSVVRLYNAGDSRGACDAFLAFDKAGKGAKRRVLPGLVRRRQEERALCLKGI